MENHNEKKYATAGFFEVEGSDRNLFHFSAGWRFTKGNPQNAFSMEYDDCNWEIVNLPHGLEICAENASGMRNYQGPSWYRKEFRIPNQMIDKKYYLYFEAVMGKCEIWLNGQKLQEHFGGYLPFAVEISEHIRAEGQKNVIAVYADNSNDPLFPPGKPQEELDFSYFGGIYRDVYLIEMNPVHATLAVQQGRGVLVGTRSIEGNTAFLEIHTEIKNESRKDCNLLLTTVLVEDEEKRKQQSQTSFVLKAGEQKNLIQHMRVDEAKLWHPEEPNLYFIETEISENQVVYDKFRTRFGIRLIEMRGEQGLYINQRPYSTKLSGVNRHQDYVYVGNALPKSGQWRDALLLREGGSHIVRAAHYPLSEAFMDACDELGLFVTVANPGWQFYNNVQPCFEERMYEDTRAMVRRDRNHPAVLLWEIALNETDVQPIETVRKMHEIVHQEFPLEGVYTCADREIARKADLDFYYQGTMEDKQCSFRREYGDGEEVDNFYSQNAMVRVKREFGESAMLQQVDIRVKDFEELYAYGAKRIGAAIWAGIDHQRGYHPEPFWGGVLDYYRLPKYSYYLMKSQYDTDYHVKGITTGPFIYIAHELSQVSKEDVTIFTNCEKVRLTWLGKEIGIQAPEEKWKHIPHPPVIFRHVFDFHEISTYWRDRTDKIKMIAEGLIGEQVVCVQEKQYAERLSRISLYQDSLGIPLIADGSDFVPIRAVLVDNKGVPKVLSSEYIHFTIEGEGEIIEDDSKNINPVKTQFGVATVLVRSTLTAGKITVYATSHGIGTQEITFYSLEPKYQMLYEKDYCTNMELSSLSEGELQSMIKARTNYERDETNEIGNRELENKKLENKKIENMEITNKVKDDWKENLQIQKMKEEILELKLKLVSKEQDIMDLRGRMKDK